MLDDNGGLPAQLPLSTACMMLGNFEAYRALDCEEIPNNGFLHAAVFLALPRFVRGCWRSMTRMKRCQRSMIKWYRSL